MNIDDNRDEMSRDDDRQRSKEVLQEREVVAQARTDIETRSL